MNVLIACAVVGAAIIAGLGFLYAIVKCFEKHFIDSDFDE